MKPDNYIILITSNEPWGDIWFSKQHYAYELSKMGHQVYFINPTNKWTWLNIFSFKVDFTATNYKNLTVVSYKNNFPQTIFNTFFTKLNDFINYIKLNRTTKQNNQSLIWWQFEPFRFIFPFFKNRKIYHVVDPYSIFWQDRVQATYSNLVICTNPAYIEHYKLLNKNVIYIPHGISEEEFLVNQEKVYSLQKKYGNYAVLIGNIAPDLNIELLKLMVENNIKIIVIGNESIVSKAWIELKNHHNLHYLGSINAKEINNYIAASKVCLVAYLFNKEITKDSRTPLKIINYLAQNKPIISSILTPLNKLETEAIFYAFNAQDYINCVKNTFEGKLIVNKKIVADYLATIMYPKLIENILKNIN